METVKDLQSLGIGSINLGKLKLTNVLYVKGLKFNLISGGVLADKGYYMISRSTTCSLISDETEQVVMKGVRKGKGELYRALYSDVEICLVTQTNISELSWLWHKRLGHLNFKTMKSLLNRELVCWHSQAEFQTGQPVWLLSKREAGQERF